MGNCLQKEEIKMENKIRIMKIEKAEPMYSPKYNEFEPCNKKLVLEDREHWLSKKANLEANFDILRKYCNTRFFELLVDGEAVSHFVLQTFNMQRSYISWVYTRKDYRGLKLTQDFLYRVINSFQESGYKGNFGLRVEKTNLVMCRLVENLGFEKGETGTAVEKISDEQDEYEYVLTKQVRE